MVAGNEETTSDNGTTKFSVKKRPVIMVQQDFQYFFSHPFAMSQRPLFFVSI